MANRTNHPTKHPDKDIISFLEKHGPTETAKILGMSLRTINTRRRRLEEKYNFRITVPATTRNNDIITERYAYSEHSGRSHREVKNGVVIVAGDNHYEPGVVTVMHRAVVKLCKELQPVGVVLNGDVNDFARLSRFQKITFSDQPHCVSAEIEAAQDRVGEITKAAGRAWKYWPLGNHDMRFNQAIMEIAKDPKGAEYVALNGRTLKDYFPLWDPCWAVWINQGTPGFTVIQHRCRGGEHSAYRNAKEMHCHYVTGHDHHPYIRGYTSAVQTVYGVNHGMVADIDQSIFVNWTEARPLNWRSACSILTYAGGLLMPPELCEKLDNDHVWFRGKVIQV